jgi:hypothetical protein
MGHEAGIGEPVSPPNAARSFQYSDAPLVRRHGPRGYARYEGFRPWLRDEFAFRCVYCLTRERWGKGQYGFQVDHLIPQSMDFSRIFDYDNLFYVCATCNEMKSDAEEMPNPFLTAYGRCLAIDENGLITALSSQGTMLIKILRLDNRENTEYRRLVLENLRLALAKDANLYRKWMSFPDDMPDLAAKRPPQGNSRPQGVRESFFTRRRRNELPEVY